MNKVYFTAPIIAMALFAGYYVYAHRGTAERELAHAQQLKLEKEAALKAEAASRQQAIAEALKLQELRKKERAEKEARDLADQEARQKLIEQRDRTFREQDKLAKQIDRLKKELELEQVATTKLQEEFKLIEAERTFLAEFVRRAGANVQALQKVLTQIAADSSRPATPAAPKSS